LLSITKKMASGILTCACFRRLDHSWFLTSCLPPRTPVCTRGAAGKQEPHVSTPQPIQAQ
ncbi:hypothetical protein KUCAC02_001162, partial [Chaenocephalus aceratus]